MRPSYLAITSTLLLTSSPHDVNCFSSTRTRSTFVASKAPSQSHHAHVSASVLTMKGDDTNGNEADPSANANANETDMKMETAFNSRLNEQISNDISSAKNAISVALEERITEEEIARKDAEIAQLVKQKQDRETNINRLKFQLNEFKRDLEESESQKVDLENDLNLLQSQSQDVDAKKKEDNDNSAKELKAISEELSQTRIAAKEQLQQAQRDANKEKQQLLSEISKRTSELEETTSRMNQVMEESDSNNNDEIQKLSQESQHLQSEIKTLKGQLQEIQKALVESETFTTQLEEQIDTLQKENKQARKADQNLLERFKSQFKLEKDSLTQQLQSYSEELVQLKNEKEKELTMIRNDAEGERQKLLAEIDSLAEELETVKGQIDEQKAQVVEARREADAKVKRQAEKSRKLDRAVKGVAAQEKKLFKKQIWDLQSEKESAKFNLFAAQREASELKASVALFEEQLKELEESNAEQVDELENRVRADEMFYAQSKASAKTRMQGLVEKFQRRLVRRESSFKKDIEDLRNQLTNQFDTDKAELNTQREIEVEIMRIKGVDKLDNAQIEFDAKVADLTKQMNSGKVKAQQKISDMKKTFASELKLERVKAKKEKDALIAEKDRIEYEARVAYDQLMTSMNMKLIKASEENQSLRQTIDEKNLLIRGYESERSSFRSMARLTWKVTKAKITKRRGQ